MMWIVVRDLELTTIPSPGSLTQTRGLTRLVMSLLQPSGRLTLLVLGYGASPDVRKDVVEIADQLDSMPGLLLRRADGTLWQAGIPMIR